MSDLPIRTADAAARSNDPEEQRSLEFLTLRELFDTLTRRRRSLLGVILGSLVLCLAYNLVVPRKYQASSRVALRVQPGSFLSIESTQPVPLGSLPSSPLQLETTVDTFRAERLAWRVILNLKLYRNTSFAPHFTERFAGFDPSKPSPEAQSYLLDRFEKNLTVHALPRTLLIQVDVRSRDPAIAAAIVNTVVQEYSAQEAQSRREVTSLDTGWLDSELHDLTAQVEQKEKRLAEFERQHNFLSTQQSTQDGQRIDTLHDPSIQQVEEVGRLLATASGDRVLREALYREAQAGSPELVLAANPEMRAELGEATLLQQLHSRSSEIDLELAQLKAEHGPNFPRVLELDRASADIVRQIAAENTNLLESFRRNWTSAADREQLLRRQMEDRMNQGLRQNDALLQYSVLHEEVISERSLCSRMQTRIREAGLASGMHGSSITVVDPARVPFKPVSPNWGANFAVTLVLALMIALGVIFWDHIWKPRPHAGGHMKSSHGIILLTVISLGLIGRCEAQAPTPSTSGLPAGVVRLTAEPASTIASPNPKEAPEIWNGNNRLPPPASFNAERSPSVEAVPLSLPIAAGDILTVSEFHVPEFRSVVRVDEKGSVLLPMVGQLNLGSLTETQAAQLIEKAFLDQGLLLHPHVSVLVTSAVGQDVSVMGEVTRPGVYPYTAHHRMLDLISAASGLAPSAGRLVTLVHRDDPNQAHAIVLDPSGIDKQSEHNPELKPGDTILVSRAGLAYVIGDVVRPGGFAVDPIQGLTVVQALSLAWGATPNASVSKAILIRDQPGGRTLTTLNLRRMIRGQDPDQPVRDRDILFVPDSATKTLLNRSLESAIQSAIGVTIYAGLVYSQRF